MAEQSEAKTHGLVTLPAWVKGSLNFSHSKYEANKAQEIFSPVTENSISSRDENKGLKKFPSSSSKF